MPIADFADNLGCTRVHAHRILKKDNIDIILLKRISRLLNHDFFKEISECREFGYM